MRTCALVLALALPGAAAALTPGAFEGRWQGEGTLVLGAEPPERFRCQISLQPAAGETIVLSGRCATAQGAQSFVYQISGPQIGPVVAQNRSNPPDTLPAVMQGRADAAGLHFQAEDGVSFDLLLSGDTLRFVIAGHDRRGPARGEAVLSRRD